jgi:murein DD-endopeptidase MepM/ murein hydrolase activator NlpD
MAQHKYRFNTKSLTFERARLTAKEIFWRVLSYLGTGLVFTTVVLLIAYNFFSSPKERILKRENEQLKLQFQLLDEKMQLVEAVMNDLQRRDDEIYRVIFEADPIPSSIRKSGFGGVNRYKELEGYNDSKLVIEANKKLDQLNKQLYIQSKSFDEVMELASRKTEMLMSIPSIQPVANNDLKKVASGFGYRTHPIYKIHHFHTGLDFTASIGTEIYATGNGRVIKVESDYRGYGNHVIIEHGYGYQTLYAHMSKFAVRPGQSVKRGDLIGYVGNSGTSTGPHLHYEVIKNGNKVNPINFFYNDLSPEEYELVLNLSSQSNQSFD